MDVRGSPRIIIVAEFAVLALPEAGPRDCSPTRRSPGTVSLLHGEGTDREAELGLPVSAFMDRKKEPLARQVLNSQIGLITVLTQPFFHEWGAFLWGGATTPPLSCLHDNLLFWETEGEEAIRTHPAFLARWNTKRKPLHHYHLLPGAQPVTSGGASLGASRTSAHRGT